MPVWALDLNHTTASLDLRDRFALTLNQTAPTLHSLCSSFPSGRQPQVEAAIISTCNRTEIYCASEHAALDHTFGCLTQSGGLPPALLRSHTYTLHDDQAAGQRARFDGARRGPDPRQMKDAVRAAETAGAPDSRLNHPFQRSFAVAKEVRSATEIGAHSISMAAAAAVWLAGQLFEDLQQTRVLLVGAGEMIDRAATHFAAKDSKWIAIANRTLERGEKLASRFSGEAGRPSLAARQVRHPGELHRQDAADHRPGCRGARAQGASTARCSSIVLPMPRDIEPGVKTLEDIYLYTVYDLAQVVQQGQANRQAAVAQAEVTIDVGVQSFMHWLNFQSTPTSRTFSCQSPRFDLPSPPCFSLPPRFQLSPATMQKTTRALLRKRPTLPTLPWPQRRAPGWQPHLRSATRRAIRKPSFKCSKRLARRCKPTQ